MNNNLVLTEHAIKRHCKRLQKEMQLYNKDFTLGESQNLFAKVLGFNSWFNLKEVIVNKPEKIEPQNEKKDGDVINILKKWEQQLGCEDEVNNNYLKMLSEIYVYEKYINNSEVRTVDKCFELLQFAINNKEALNFNLINKEGFDLLQILFIVKIATPFRLWLIDKLMKDGDYKFKVNYANNYLSLSLVYYSTKSERKKILEKIDMLQSWKINEIRQNHIIVAIYRNVEIDFLKLLCLKLSKENDMCNEEDYWGALINNMLYSFTDSKKYRHSKEIIHYMINNKVENNEEVIRKILKVELAERLSEYKYNLYRIEKFEVKNKKQNIIKNEKTLNKIVSVLKDLESINPKILNNDFLNYFKDKYLFFYNKII